MYSWLLVFLAGVALLFIIAIFLTVASEYLDEDIDLVVKEDEWKQK